jgi:NIPSNAP protein
MKAAQRPAFETIEIRRYTLHPGARERLIDLFEREFIETQESCGMVPLGHYRDLDDPDAFVWFRGFATFDSRAQCLEAFYVHGKAWAANREAANATMIDSDDVLMLRSARPYSGFDLDGLERDPAGAAPTSFVAVSIARVSEEDGETFASVFERESLERLQRYGSRIAYFLTEPRPNAFPRLPVRKDSVFAVVGVCQNLEQLKAWSAVLLPRGFETMRLAPASRSLYR